MPFLGITPIFESIRDRPAVRALLQQAGLGK
jgi:hypothetical protein